MQIQLNAPSLAQPTTLYKLNANTSQIGAALNGVSGKNGENRDSVTISPMGKAMSRMESLMKQKESLNERKHELIEKALESGGNLSDIQEQLDSFDESLKMMDEQMSDLIIAALEPDSKKAEETKQDGAEDAPKTEEEAQTEQISAFTALAGSIESLKTTSSVKTHLESRVKVLRQEIKQDKAVAQAHGENLELSIGKEDKIEAAEEKIENLSKTTGEALQGIQQTIREQQAPSTDDPAQEEEDRRKPQSI